MDERRFRIYISIVVGILIFSGARVITQTNPVYDFAEPVLSRLNEFSADIALVEESVAEPNQALQSKNLLLSQENDELREELELKTSRKAIRAEITRRDLLTYRKLVWVNVGNNDGVKRGQTVLHRDSLFGVVDEVFDDSALVNTILDPEFRATVRAEGEQGVLKVEHGSLIIDLVPSKQLEGAAIETDGLDGRTIVGIHVGLTDRQIANESDVFGAYNVQLPYSLYDADVLDIVISEGEQ